jgi:hypothetical protein
MTKWDVQLRSVVMMFLFLFHSAAPPPKIRKMKLNKHRVNLMFVTCICKIVYLL